jgi:hypothetical protein
LPKILLIHDENVLPCVGGWDAARLKERLLEIQDKPVEEKKRKLFKGKSIGKAGVKNEE